MIFFRAGGVVGESGDYNKIYIGGATPNYYINNNTGALVYYAGWYATDFFEINPEGGEVYFAKAQTGSNAYYNCFYDENKNYLGYFDTNGVVSIPTSAKYFRLSGTTNFNNTYYFNHI